MTSYERKIMLGLFLTHRVLDDKDIWNDASNPVSNNTALDQPRTKLPSHLNPYLPFEHNSFCHSYHQVTNLATVCLYMGICTLSVWSIKPLEASSWPT